MSTVGNLIDRTLREWLEPPGERPAEVPLNGAINDTATSLSVVDGVLSAEDESAIGPGTLLEIDREVIFVTAAAPPVVSLMVRGWMGTTAAAHDDAAPVRILGASARWTREGVFGAVCDSIEELYPPLYRTVGIDFVADTTPVELEDEQAVGVLEFRYWDGRGYRTHPVEFLSPFPHVSSDRAVQFDQPAPSGDGYLVYMSDWARPTAESDELTDDDFGLPTRYDLPVIVSAVAKLASGIDLDAVTQEFITRQLEAQNFPVESGASIQNSLLGLYEYLIVREQRRLTASRTTNATRRQTRYKVV